MANTISDKLEYLEGTKSAIKDAIVAKGVAVEDTATFRSYAEKIGEISGGGGGKVNLNDYKLNLAFSKLYQSDYDKLSFSFDTEESTENFFQNTYLNEITVNLSPIMHILNYDLNYTFYQLFCADIIFPAELYCKNLNWAFYNMNSLNSTPSIQKIIVEIGGNTGFSNAFNYSCINIDEIEFNSTYPSVSIAGSSAFSNLQEKVTKLPTMKFNIAEESRVINMVIGGMYDNLPSSITEIPEWDVTSLSAGEQNFSNWPFYSWTSENTFITDMGGIVGLKAHLDLSKLPNLNTSAVDNILNKAADLSSEVNSTITFNSAVYEALTEEQKALATSKNWTLASA